jgi:hypothetical protein
VFFALHQRSILILGLAQKKEMARTISLLVLYNLIFILPMILSRSEYFGVRLEIED